MRSMKIPHHHIIIKYNGSKTVQFVEKVKRERLNQTAITSSLNLGISHKF